MLTNIVALTAGLATTASAFTCTGNYFSFFNRGGDTLDYARIDPSVYPGIISPHLHSFDGGSGLGAKTTFNDLMGSDCTTARVKQDKSLYWRPSLFFKSSDGEFHRVPERESKIYYKYGDGDKWANVTGFPEEFSMIAGYPNKRSEGSFNNDAGVRWGCHQPDGRDDKIFANGFPKGFQSCAYGFASEVTFPSCWNGKEVDPKDPHAHMAYPSGYGGVGIENCPTSHRAARFPTIFVEFWYDISSFDKQYAADSSPWVLSTGDETGLGFHGDFMNGWEKGVLEKATAESGGCNCGCGCGQTEMEQCFGKENVNNNDDAAFKSCKAMRSSVGQDSATTMEKLPGCNPLTSGPEDATMVDCGANGAPIGGGGNDDVPAASKTPVASYAASSAMASSEAASNGDAEASSIASFPIKNPVNPTAASDVYGEPTPSLDRTPAGSEIPKATPAASEGYGAPSPSVDATPAGSETIKPTAAASEEYGSGFSTMPTPSAGEPASPPENNLPSVTPSGAVGGKPTGTPAGQESCKEPVYVTVTPTIYVTAGAVSNTTSCVPTITHTVKDVTYVTVGSY